MARERNWKCNMSCVHGTAFGTPVVPEVKKIMASLSVLCAPCGDGGAEVLCGRRGLLRKRSSMGSTGVMVGGRF